MLTMLLVIALSVASGIRGVQLLCDRQYDRDFGQVMAMAIGLGRCLLFVVFGWLAYMIWDLQFR